MALGLIRCQHWKKIGVGCSIGGQRRSRTIPSSPKPSTIFIKKAGFQLPSVLLLPVSTAAAEFQSWLLGKASIVWYLVRSLCSRVEHAAVALVSLVLALCQQGKVGQQAGEVAG